jgi:hypothetical protein
MTAMDVRTSDTRTGTMRSGDMGTDDMGHRLVGASLGSLVFQVGHLGAGLGWHGSGATHTGASGTAVR